MTAYHRLIGAAALMVYFCFSAVAFAANPHDEALVRDVEKLRSASQPLQFSGDSDYSVSTLVQVVRWMQAQPKPATCQEARVAHNSVKFATTYDAAGKPCKIYDLSFPTLRGLFDSIVVSSVPVQKLSSEDYRAWLRGDYDSVYKKMDDLRAAAFDQHTGLQESWFSKLKFKSDRQAGINTTTPSFRLSDLEVGPHFRFSRSQKQELLAVFRSNQGGMGSLSVADGSVEALIDNPEALLSKIRFDWNEAKRVFDVFVEFDFLPIVGPIDLVDYNTQYKAIAERMIRSILLRAFTAIAGYIPEPTTQHIVKLGLTEAFDFIELMYDYHRNQLEDTLRLNLDGTIATEVPAEVTEKGLNLIFVSRMSLVSEYLTSAALGKPFDLGQLDKRGKALRYSVDKGRDALAARLHSRLVLKNGCETEALGPYFAVCKKEGKRSAVHSLLSEHLIYMYSLGAPVVHRYAFPAEVLLKRGTSYLMAMGLQVFRLPVPSFVTGELVKILKGFAVAGMQDEAYLLNRITELKRNNDIKTDEGELLSKWLFGQNINPFLLKSEKLEDRLISTNAKRLTSTLNQGGELR